MKKNSVFVLFLFTFFGISCQKGKTLYTDSGMKYILYSTHTGEKAVLGDYVTFEMVYKTASDSVLFDSRINGVPFRMQLVKIPFKGSMEEGLTYLATGDSAIFFVSADSLNEKIFKDGNNTAGSSLLTPGSHVKFEIKLLDIQTKAEAEKEIAINAEKRKAAEPEKIKGYVEKNNITALPDTNGIYIITDKLTEGKIKDGDVVSVNYESRYLNGVMFDSNKSSNKPFVFQMGTNQVIKSWEVVFKKLYVGSKATIISPSSMAYGELGLRNTGNGTFIVPPYCGLVFEVEVLDVKRTSAAK